jgi:hypothetical protein
MYLIAARDAYLTHPLQGGYAFRDQLDASLCRIVAVFGVGGLETMLTRHRAWAQEALAFWHEYWQRAATAFRLDEAEISDALELLESPEFTRAAGDAGRCWLLHNLPDEGAALLVDSAVDGETSFTSQQVVNAFKAGSRAYEFVPNITPVTLFTVRIPIADPANTPVYIREANRALRAFRLNCAWYSWVEYRRPPGGEGLEFYDQISQEFASRPSGRSAL